MYYTTSNMSRWLDANNNCTLASPGVTLLQTSAEVGVNLGNASLGLSNGTELWMGYVRQPVLLLHIGCLDVIENSNKLSVSHGAGNDVGLCLSLCGGSIQTVGVMADGCFCLGDLSGLNLNSSRCTDKCARPDGVLCGGHKSMSVYSIVPGELSKSIIEQPGAVYNVGDCVSFNGNTKEMLYSKCSIPLRAFCQVAEGQARVLTTASSFYLPWDRIAFECTKAGNQSLNYNTTLSIPTPSHIWTGMIRAVVVLDRLVSLSGKTEFGYLKMVNNTYKLMFDQVPSAVRRSLCVNESNVPSTVSITKSTSRKTTPAQTVTMTTKTPEPEPEAEPVTAKSSYMFLVYILVPLAVVVIIIFIVICAVRHRKRRLEIQKIEAELMNELASRDKNVDMSGFVISTLPRSEKKARKPQQTNGNAGYDHSGEGQPINGYGTSDSGYELTATVPLDNCYMTQLENADKGRDKVDSQRSSPENGRDREYAKIGKHAKGSPGTPLKNRNLGTGNGSYNVSSSDPLYDQVPV
ncbi:uncharacterized protein LOC127860621 [Dreissena polymorpha]|nr:uncharacterized protein LOC127860621 [Dreissena polymorpha]